ncbi:hypothetical protein [Rhizobium leguminosarum]|uniref:Uncharacterized protein n=1 Tax=Rhizobium leguminosarum TaxID=384 RepID=A0A2K9ZGL1_RHILE|nr:hypothetical protein [Rhizobium leguminosarum]AUW47330.1 hypothetical protein CUJ84_pRLN3000201 [Rhizobium leguminosarum]
MGTISRAMAVIACIFCVSCGGNLIETVPGNIAASSEGAVDVPLPYYLPRGVIILDVSWDESKKSVEYASDFKAHLVADQNAGPLVLAHRHIGLSSENATVEVDPSSMLLSKVSSTFTPQRTEALNALSAVLAQVGELRAALTPKSDRAEVCTGTKVRAEIPLGGLQKVKITEISKVADCKIDVKATVTAVDSGLTRDTLPSASLSSVRALCREAICLRPARLYSVSIKVSVSSGQITPKIPSFTVASPDMAKLAFIKFKPGAFASKSTTLEFTDGMLKSYQVANSSEVVGFLGFTAAAIGTATAVATLR